MSSINVMPADHSNLSVQPYRRSTFAKPRFDAVGRYAFGLCLLALVAVACGCRGNNPMKRFVRVTETPDSQLAEVQPPQQRLVTGKLQQRDSMPEDRRVALSQASPESPTPPVRQVSGRTEPGMKTATQDASLAGAIGQSRPRVKTGYDATGGVTYSFTDEPPVRNTPTMREQSGLQAGTGLQDAIAEKIRNNPEADYLSLEQIEEVLRSLNGLPPEARDLLKRRIVAQLQSSASKTGQPKTIRKSIAEQLKDIPNLPSELVRNGKQTRRLTSPVSPSTATPIVVAAGRKSPTTGLPVSSRRRSNETDPVNTPSRKTPSTQPDSIAGAIATTTPRSEGQAIINAPKSSPQTTASPQTTTAAMPSPDRRGVAASAPKPSQDSVVRAETASEFEAMLAETPISVLNKVVREIQADVTAAYADASKTQKAAVDGQFELPGEALGAKTVSMPTASSKSSMSNTPGVKTAGGLGQPTAVNQAVGNSLSKSPVAANAVTTPALQTVSNLPIRKPAKSVLEGGFQTGSLIVSPEKNSANSTVQHASAKLPGSTEAAVTQAAPTTSPDALTKLDDKALFEQLIGKLKNAPDGESEAERTARLIKLRHLLVLSGQSEAATEEIEHLSESEQAYLQHYLKGLSTIVDPTGHPIHRRRLSEAVREFRKATQMASAATDTLEVNNVSFCTEVLSFAQKKTFRGNRFKNGQQVILYAEVDNFSSQETSKGYMINLRGTYELFDEDNQKVAEQVLPADPQTSSATLRDYFVAYKMFLPTGLKPGTYRLKLTMEDLEAKKYGQASIPLEITR